MARMAGCVVSGDKRTRVMAFASMGRKDNTVDVGRGTIRGIGQWPV